MNARIISIIGGGASATLLLAHYARCASTHKDHIRIYERGGVCGRGLAYGTKHPEHLLNVRANRMSGLADAPDHFADFAKEHGIDADDFAPRMIYGDYLQYLLDDAIARLESRGSGVEVISAYIDEDRMKQLAASSDITVIATGNACQIMPDGADDLGAADGWHSQPWSMNYDMLDADEPVIILGTGLSMVDALQSLAARDFRGKITALARNGLMPRRHAPPLPPYPAFLNAGDAALRANPTAYQLLHRVRAEIRDAAARGVMWQAVIDSLRHDTNELWQLLPVGEQKKFLRRLMSFWAVHRHRMPPQVHDVAEGFLQNGQLQIRKDPVMRVERNVEGGLRVITRDGIHKARHVINGLGYRYPAWRAIRDYKNCYQIGPPCFGALLETTAIPEIRAQASALAQKIAE